MKSEVFQQYLDQGYNRIPMVKPLLTDFDTGLGLYHKVAQGAYSFLFESVHGGERWGRYSIIGLPAKEWVTVANHSVSVHRINGNRQASSQSQTVKDPIAYLLEYYESFKVPQLTDLPRFYGGLVGYFGYDSVGFFEKKLISQLQKQDPVQLPDIVLMLCDELVVLDNLSGTVSIVVFVSAQQVFGNIRTVEAAQQRLEDIAHQLLQPQPWVAHSLAIGQRGVRDDSELEFLTSESDYCDYVARIKDYIAAGDVMQVVPSQRMSMPFRHDPLQLYRALRYLNPSPYLFFLNLGTFHIVGSSPEILVRSEFEGKLASQKTVTVRPIAGTRPRGATLAEDQALATELLNDPKEIAEHVMLMDLGRNDIGRIAKTGSVKVTQDRQVEKYSHVMHIVSNVEGKLQAGLHPFDVLRATFPAGTLSGAPKIRAMEIINELEPIKRGVYGGAVGYIGFDQSMDLAIVIRTAVIKDERLYVQAGAGIVADSQPQMEWQETLNKAKAVLNAMDLSFTIDPLTNSK